MDDNELREQVDIIADCLITIGNALKNIVEAADAESETTSEG